MIPSTIVAILIFLLFIAPGMSYELLRRRTTHPREESSFVEIARVVLFGTLISAITFALLIVIHFTSPQALIDLPQLLINGQKYVSSHVMLTAWTLLFELTISTLIAVILSDLIRTGREERVYAKDAWHQVAEELAQDRYRVGMSVRLSSDIEVLGYYVGASTELDPGKRELILEGPLTVTPIDGAKPPAKMDEAWQFIVIPGNEIRYVTSMRIGTDGETGYSPQKSQVIRGRLRGTWLSWKAAGFTLLCLLTAIVIFIP